jgi:ligand-binding SRPBCC domain-containing protein
MLHNLFTMRFHTINKSVIVKTSLNKAWEFIRNPENLNLITPENMDFRIVSDLPGKMFNGLTIAYRVKIPFMGITDWLTEIKHIREPYAFVDEQRVGPYKLWYHYHELEAVDGGIKIIDKVHYQLPFGIFGHVAHLLFVRRTLMKIFDYRNVKFKELLEDNE